MPFLTLLKGKKGGAILKTRSVFLFITICIMSFFPMSLFSASNTTSKKDSASELEAVELPNPSFEEGGQGIIRIKEGFVDPEGTAFLGVPDGWNAYQWGSPRESRYSVTVEKGVSHSGNSSMRLENIDALARGGVYCYTQLEAGTYEISVWVRIEKGKTSKVRMYLGTAYSSPFKVTEQWTRVVFQKVVSTDLEKAEINIHQFSEFPSVIWVDDVELHRVVTVKYNLVPDTRKERPRTLLFSPININYLRDTAKEWASHGFRGFLFDGVMVQWSSDVWSVDGNTATRGEDDGLYKEMYACNAECKRYGIDSNFVKVAFYQELPDWFDDAAWEKITKNFAEGARFARMTGCAGLAIDTEYVSKQYASEWEGYKKNPHELKELKSKVCERFRAIVAVMLKEYPGMVLMTLPEGMICYGDLYTEIFIGMLQACFEAKAPGGLHVMTEGTYHIVDAVGLVQYPDKVSAAIEEDCPKPMVDYWRERCSIAMGVWPLGYYRAISDANGKFLGWGGKKETFGDEIVGSYSDKSEWYPIEKFKEQMAAVNSFCPRYNWIYGHGDVFTQWTDEQLKKYRQCVHNKAFNATLPTVSNLKEYCDIIAKPMLVVREK